MWEAADEGIVDGWLQNLVSPEDIEVVVNSPGPWCCRRRCRVEVVGIVGRQE
jgi:hypothetical protein